MIAAAVLCKSSPCAAAPPFCGLAGHKPVGFRCKSDVQVTSLFSSDTPPRGETQMTRTQFRLLLAIGLVVFTTAVLAYPSAAFQKRHKGGTAGAQPQWGSGPANAQPDAPSGPAVVSGCGLTTLRFNELPFQPVNGLSFRGARFSFSIGGVPSLDAVYNGSGPGQGVFVQDPSLEGNALGVLEIEFPALTPTLSFGIARSVAGPLNPGLTLVLLDVNGNLIQVVNVNTAVQVGGFFSEAMFTYALATPIRRAIFLFPSANVAPRFALDNLTYRAFDRFLQDDTTLDTLQWNSVTGDFQFVHCVNGLTVSGRGGAVIFGCNLFFGAGGGNKGGPAQVQASVNTCTNSGSATVTILPAGATFTIVDSNTTDDLCTCGAM